MPIPFRRRRFGFGTLVGTWIGGLVAAGCGGGHQPVATGPTASAVVGASGGTVATSDGALTVAIPAGALAAATTVTVTPTSSPGGAVGTVYEIGPTGTQFSAPVTLSLHYDPASLNGGSEGSLRVATFTAGTWQILAGAAVDTSAKIVTGTTTHLSLYGLILESNGAICATVAGGSNCGSSSTGPAALSCTPSTCAGATDVCGSYPGATMTACTDGSNGYIATCCFAPGASVCFASTGGGSTCTNGPTGSAGATCPPAITCATATDACTAYPGATLQSCVDGTNSYSGSCCFAPGAPVCTTIGAARSCGGAATGNGTGGGTTTCPPAPSCADGDPCAGAPGSTMQSCTDSSDGYTATCCFPLGELPPTAGSPTGSGGGVDAGNGGTTTGPTDAGSGGAPPNGDGSTTTTTPPPPTDGGSTMPPPPADAGAPPPSDAGAAACQIKAMPASGAGMPCGVTEVCPANGNMYRVQCDGTGAPCSCLLMGQATSTTITASCTALDPASMLAMCGFPSSG